MTAPEERNPLQAINAPADEGWRPGVGEDANYEFSISLLPIRPELGQPCSSPQKPSLFLLASREGGRHPEADQQPRLRFSQFPAAPSAGAP
jgi:hypothetical protein